MKLSLTELALRLDEWASQRLALITENDASLVIGRLAAPQAKALIELSNDVAWPSGQVWSLRIEDRSESDIKFTDIEQDFGPFKISLAKPVTPGAVAPLVTNAGLADWLSRAPSKTRVWCARLLHTFETLAVRFEPWGTEPLSDEFQPQALLANPRKIVRDPSATVPIDLSPWLLRPGSEIVWDDPGAMVWAEKATIALSSSLSNEIEGDGTLMFRGPPVTRYQPTSNPTKELSEEGFRALQQAARWVFESPAEIETRQGLLAAELARTNVGASNIATLFRLGSGPALEGAKIAHSLGLQKLSLESLKAMADLRKAVADEAAKLSDATRQLAAAVAGAVFAGVGVIAARLTVVPNDGYVIFAIIILGVVLCLYIGAVVLSGRQFMSIQQQLRLQWRDKLYRFLPPAEYKAMVEVPAKRAEDAFNLAACLGTVLAGLLLIAVLAASFAPIGAKAPPVTAPSAKELPK